jgi:glutaredoxin
MSVVVWSKIGCGWCYDVTDLLRDRGLPFEERIVNANPEHWREMIQKSGQTLAPVVEIDGHLLVDTDADEVAEYLDRVASPPKSV